jgi:hypothetical protein
MVEVDMRVPISIGVGENAILLGASAKFRVKGSKTKRPVEDEFGRLSWECPRIPEISS